MRVTVLIHREGLVHGIKHRAKRKDSDIHVTHVSDGDKHSSCRPSAPEIPERSVQRTHFIVREGTARAWCDGGHSYRCARRSGWPRCGAGHRPIGNCGTHTKKLVLGSKLEFEMERGGVAEGPCEASLVRYVGVVVCEEAGFAEPRMTGAR